MNVARYILISIILIFSVPILAYTPATSYTISISNQEQPFSTNHTRSSHTTYGTQIESQTSTFHTSSFPSTNIYNTHSIVSSSAPQMATTTYDDNYNLGGIRNRAASFDDLFADGGLPDNPDEPLATPLGDTPLVFILLLIAIYACLRSSRHIVA